MLHLNGSNGSRRPQEPGTVDGPALAVIPARGGSKQVPRKNLKLLGGKPLIQWSIEAARASTELDRCIVSTDDEEIAEVARSLGAEVPFLRPAEYAQDNDARSSRLPARAAPGWASTSSTGPAMIVHLRPTLPFREPRQIDDVVRLMRRDRSGLREVCVPRAAPSAQDVEAAR